jgi:uncharacterized protein (DUF952 family)
MKPPVTYHLVPVEEWEGSDGESDYLPPAFVEDGFIHCTDGADELANTANRHYRDDPRPFVALQIDVSLLSSPVRYEDARRVYPHIYGPLNRDAILTVVSMPRDEAGRFLPPALGERR